jgi:hypothetical protein
MYKYVTTHQPLDRACRSREQTLQVTIAGSLAACIGKKMYLRPIDGSHHFTGIAERALPVNGN